MRIPLLIRSLYRLFSIKQAKKASEENKRSKTIAHETEILELLTRYGEMKLSDIALEINLSEQRVRAIISKMNEVIPIGNTTSRKYILKE